MRSELSRMTSLLENYTISNERMMNKMQDNVTEVKNQIAEMKLTNEQTISLLRENITEIKTDIIDIKSSSLDMALEQNSIKTQVAQLEKKICTSENKIKSLELNLDKTKATYPSVSSEQLEAKPDFSEQLIREVQDRTEREKNVIVVGLPEQNALSAAERLSKDKADIINITRSIIQDIPNPTKVIRIGKYNATKCRRVKVIYDIPGPAKQLLRSRDKLPQNIQIYSDQTPTQQKYLQSLKEELARRLDKGETDLTIKYIGGTPKIIKTNSKNSTQ